MMDVGTLSRKKNLAKQTLIDPLPFFHISHFIPQKIQGDIQNNDRIMESVDERDFYFVHQSILNS